MPPTARLAREYLRVSDDKAGDLASPDEQHAENAGHAARSGWDLGVPYAEAGAVSASRHSAKVRDAFARLLADLEGGRFGAQILILWESSRGSRKVGEWVRLIEACESASVLIYVTTHSRSYDPSNARDRRTLLEDAVDSEYESAKTRKRVLRSTAARAARGEPHGRVPYGYQRVYDPVTRRLAAQESHPQEAPLVAELFRRLHAGDSLRGIERDWAGRGIVTRGQKGTPPRPFAGLDLRTMALNAAYAGLRVRTPKGDTRVLGSVEGATPAKWPPIVDAEVYHAVRLMLTDPGRRKSRPGGGKHLLSLIAGCGECGDTLTVGYHQGVRRYRCRGKGCVTVPADDLDAIAVAVIIGWLSLPGTAESLRPSDEAVPELGAVRAEIGAARAALADWRRRAGLRKVTAEAYEAVEPVILAEIARLAERERELSVPPELAGWTGPAAVVARKWEGEPVAVRRVVARLVLAPGRAGVLRVAPVWPRGRRTPVPVAERVRLDRDGPLRVSSGHNWSQIYRVSNCAFARPAVTFGAWTSAERRRRAMSRPGWPGTTRATYQGGRNSPST